MLTRLSTFQAAKGPVAVAIAATSKFMLYSSGVFYDPSCTGINHAVTVVGWGSENGQDYWIIKNSWSSGWGESGYIRLSRGNNQCHLADYAYRPCTTKDCSAATPAQPSPSRAPASPSSSKAPAPSSSRAPVAPSPSRAPAAASPSSSQAPSPSGWQWLPDSNAYRLHVKIPGAVSVSVNCYTGQGWRYASFDSRSNAWTYSQRGAPCSKRVGFIVNNGQVQNVVRP